MKRVVTLLATLFLSIGLFILANSAYAQNLTVRISEYPTKVAVQYLEENDLEIGVLIYYNITDRVRNNVCPPIEEGSTVLDPCAQQTTCNQTNVTNQTTQQPLTVVTDPALYIYMYGDDGRVLYYDYQRISLNPGANYYTFYIPAKNILDGLLDGDGYVTLKAVLIATFENGERVIAEDEVLIKVVKDLFIGDVDVTRIAPDFNAMKYVERRTYNMEVTLENPSNVETDAGIYIRIYDTYGSLKLSRVTDVTLSPNSRQDVRISINFGVLEPGDYILRVDVYKYEALVASRKFEITVAPENIVPVKIYKERIFPEVYKQGDFVKVVIPIKNELNKPIIIEPIIISKDFELYRRLNTITLDANEFGEITFVMKIPENITAGRKEIKVILKYGTFYLDHKVYLYIPEKEKVINETQNVSIIEVIISGEKTLLLGKEYVYKLEITSLVEDLIPLSIKVETENAEVELENETIVIGGKGYKVTVPIKVRPIKEGIDSLKIKVIETDTGKVLYETQYEYEVPGRIELPYNKLIIILGVLVVVAIVLYLIFKKRKEKEEEKPEE